ncbi:Retrovirus-related Pol polyprotein [Arachis hypogaea]|nr:Retrovirus-related Pol polyprotein [Arachis hypogaea]
MASCLLINPRVLLHFKCYKKLLENQTGCITKSIQTDHGSEFLSNTFRSFLLDCCISHRLACPYTHQQQSSVERKHKHITEIRLSLLATTGLPLKFWEYAFITVVHLINRLPTPLLNNSSSFEALHNKELDYTTLKVFDCAFYPYL